MSYITFWMMMHMNGGDADPKIFEILKRIDESDRSTSGGAGDGSPGGLLGRLISTIQRPPPNAEEEEGRNYIKPLLVAMLKSVHLVPGTTSMIQFNDQLEGVSALVDIVPKSNRHVTTFNTFRAVLYSWYIMSAFNTPGDHHQENEIDEPSQTTVAFAIRGVIEAIATNTRLLLRLPVVKHGCHVALCMLKKWGETDQYNSLHKEFCKIYNYSTEEGKGNVLPEKCKCEICRRACRVFREVR
ncbi:hypothetical protein JKP88DRAFT_231333 [Tribonema minus]|uniref:Uncharacterized protein n=1 Tax=Tribonema minus TaxID=303371 RepID=A0A835ZCP4_9STRA|nr:hypothetical protein JKP88DRAFT_231333 [Tribonema minus]